MERVSSVRRTVGSANYASAAVLAMMATVALPSLGYSGPLDRPEDPSRATSVRVADRLQPISSKVVTPPQVQRAEKAESTLPSSFNLSAAETISVRVREQNEFSGEYRISPDMTISVARLGRVAVGSMTPMELERYLGERLGMLLRQEINVAVEVVRFRPFFMTGQVTSPGSVEWRPDLTLIQAISLSGGVARPMSGIGDIEAPERRLLLEQAKVRYSFAVAQLARLKAEKDRKDSVELDLMLGSYVARALPESRQALEAFLARQNQLLEEQRAAHESRVASLEREKESVLQELETSRTQSDEVKLQVELTESQMEGIESLKAQQLLTNTRYLDYRRSLAEIRVRYSESIAIVQRARTRYNALEREIDTLQRDRNLLLNDRIEALENEVSQLELTVGESGSLMTASNGLPPSLTYHIARKSASGVQTITANLFTEILPGDVVIVSSRQRVENGITAGVTTRASSDVPQALEETQRILESAVRPSAPTSPTTTGSTIARRASAPGWMGAAPYPSASRSTLDVQGTTRPR